MVWLLLAGAWSADDVDEEVIVWSRPFARFDDRWWSVAYEVLAPSPLEVGTVEHRLPTRAWQMEALLHCEIVEGGSRAKAVGCTVEDVALRVVRPRASARTDALIDEVRDSLIGTTFQLEATRTGKVPIVDLEGPPTRNQQELRVADSRRQLILPIAAAMNQELSDRQPGDSWRSKREPLLTLPTAAAGMSSARVAWQLDVVDGHWVAQGIGRATVAMPIFNLDGGLGCTDTQRVVEKDTKPLAKELPKNDPRLSKDVKGRPEDPYDLEWMDPIAVACVAGGQGPQVLDITQNYTLNLHTVSVVDPELGYATERIWRVQGRPTRDLIGLDVWSSGRIEVFDDRPLLPLGASGPVSHPARSTEGLADWEPIVTLEADGR